MSTCLTLRNLGFQVVKSRIAVDEYRPDPSQNEDTDENKTVPVEIVVQTADAIAVPAAQGELVAALSMAFKIASNRSSNPVRQSTPVCVNT